MHCNKFIVILVIAVLVQINAHPGRSSSLKTSLPGTQTFKSKFPEIPSPVPFNVKDYQSLPVIPSWSATARAAPVEEIPAAQKPSWKNYLWKNKTPGSQKQAASTTGAVQLASEQPPVPKKSPYQRAGADINSIGSAITSAAAPHKEKYDNGKTFNPLVLTKDVTKAAIGTTYSVAKNAVTRKPKDANVA